MKCRMIYFCDYCNKDFFQREECEKHESRHKLEEIREEYPTAVVCPDCEGLGRYYISVIGDWQECTLCGGKKFVVPLNIIRYKKIE